MELIRNILAANPSGISRDGLLAWARLRGDPAMSDADLEAALAQLGDEVVDDQGFLYLRQNAPQAALREGRSPASEPAPGSAPLAPSTPTPAEPSWTSDPGWASEPAAAPVPEPGWASEPAAAPVPEPGWASASRAITLGPAAAPDASTSESAPSWIPPDDAALTAATAGSRRTMIVAAVLVFLFLAAAGVASTLLRNAGGGSVDGGSSPAAATPTSGTVVGANSLAVGDCMIVPSEDQFHEIRRLACTEPHDGEVFAIQDYPGSAYPSDTDLESFVRAQCIPAFQAYTGSAYDSQQVLNVGWFSPTSAAWDNGDRAVACYLTLDSGGMTSQSYRGANP